VSGLWLVKDYVYIDRGFFTKNLVGQWSSGTSNNGRSMIAPYIVPPLFVYLKILITCFKIKIIIQNPRKFIRVLDYTLTSKFDNRPICSYVTYLN